MSQNEMDCSEATTPDTSEPVSIEKPLTVKKWNAVAVWMWDVECDACAICRVQLMECLRCQAETSKDKEKECIVVWGECNHAFHNCCMTQWIRQSNRCPLCQQLTTRDTCDFITFCHLRGAFRMAKVLIDDGAQEVAHVENEQGVDVPVIDVEESEEIFVKPLYTYYCHCGQMAMISDTLLVRMPLRPRDRARVIDPARTTAKTFAAAGDTVYVKRSEGLEQQYRKNCKNCTVPLFYQHPFNLGMWFIFEDALLSSQEVGGFSGNNEESKVKKIYLKRNIMNQGKTGSVTVSTMEGEEEEQVEARESAESYAMNAKVVAEALRRKGMAKDRMLGRGNDAAPVQKKKKGTLL